MDLLSEGHLEVQGLESGVWMLPLYKVHRANLTVFHQFPLFFLERLPCGALTAVVPVCKGCFLGLQHICCLRVSLTIILGIPCTSLLYGSQFQGFMPTCFLVDSNFGRGHLLVVS